MEFEQIKEFLAMPQIADIIAYFLILVVFLLQAFIKRFVRKDNTKMLFKVDAKTEKLSGLKAELFECTKNARQAQQLYEDERAILKKQLNNVKSEMNTIKRVIRIGFDNVDTLVKSGVANKVAKILALDAQSEPLKDNEQISIKKENKENKISKENLL